MIGRDPESDLVVDSVKVSRQHARIERTGDSYLVRDLGGINGTWVGDRAVTEHTLRYGDTVRIGPARLTFKSGFTQEDLKAEDSKRRPVVVIPGLGQLIDYLEENLGYTRGKDLLGFSCDFRLDLRAPARQLADAIDAWIEASGVQAPLTLICHGLGCMVARYYVEQLGGRKKVERLILMGGPHLGVPGALVNFVDCPSTYQVLPSDPFLEDDTWLPPERRALVRDAREFREELGTRSCVPAVCVFGYGLKTITRVTLEGDSPAPTIEPLGDGLIPEWSGVLDGADIHPVHQYHGALFADSGVKMLLKMELML